MGDCVVSGCDAIYLVTGPDSGEWATSMATPVDHEHTKRPWPRAIDVESIPAEGEDDQSILARVVDHVQQPIYRERGHRGLQPGPFLGPALDEAARHQ